jgi:hypothetical protein
MGSNTSLRGERPKTNRRSHSQGHSFSSLFLREEDEESEEQESGERTFILPGGGRGSRRLKYIYIYIYI